MSKPDAMGVLYFRQTKVSGCGYKKRTILHSLQTTSAPHILRQCRSSCWARLPKSLWGRTVFPVTSGSTVFGKWAAAQFFWRPAKIPAATSHCFKKNTRRKNEEYFFLCPFIASTCLNCLLAEKLPLKSYITHQVANSTKLSGGCATMLNPSTWNCIPADPQLQFQVWKDPSSPQIQLSNQTKKYAKSKKHERQKIQHGRH